MKELLASVENGVTDAEQGQSMASLWKRSPDLAAKLRPMLEASLQARPAERLPVPSEAQGRGRLRLLQRAAELRQSKAPARRRMIPVFPRVAIALTLVVALVLSSTSLVSASSGALPGDQLYPVKRTWENVRLLFVFSPEGRDLLESRYEQERLDEIDDLLGQGRSAPIVFFGLVTQQQDGQWLVSGIPVSVTAATRLPSDTLNDGAPVMVAGVTRSDGVVEAREIQLLQPGVALPPLEPSENEEHSAGGGQEDSGPVSTPFVIATPLPGSQQSGGEPKSYQFSGVVESVQGNEWNINGQTVYVDQALILGRVRIGSAVKFEGYYSSDGRFMVTRIELQSSNDSGSSGGGKGGSDDGGEHNSGEDSGGDH